MARRVEMPCCRACGYAVKGLPTFICPECGSDLREVGIATPGVPYRAWKRVRGAAAAAASLARAAGRVLTLRPPVATYRTTIERRADGRIILHPSVTLPEGRHRVVLVIQEKPEK